MRLLHTLPPISNANTFALCVLPLLFCSCCAVAGAAATGGAFGTRCFELTTEYVPVKFPAVTEFQDQGSLKTWFDGPWPQGDKKGPLAKFNASVRSTGGATATTVVSVCCGLQVYMSVHVYVLLQSAARCAVENL